MNSKSSKRHPLLALLPLALVLAIASLFSTPPASQAATVDTAAPVMAENNWFSAGFGDVGYAFFQNADGLSPRGGVLGFGSSVGVVRNALADQGSLAGSQNLENPTGGTFTAGAWFTTGLANGDLLDVATLTFGPGSPTSARIGVLVGASIIQAAGTTSDFPMSVAINGVSQTVTQGVDGAPSADWHFFDATDIAENDTIIIQASWIGNIASHKFNPVNGVAVSAIPTPNPTVTLSTDTDPVSGSYTVDVIFSEDVEGLEAGDFLVIGGTASEVMPAVGPASVYTVTITPNVDGDIEVTLPTASVVDIDDNLPNEVSNTLLTDYLAPTIPSVELFNPVTGSVVSGPYTIEIDFSEFVTGLEADDFVVTNGTASMVDPDTGSAQFFSVLITPTDTGLVSVFLPAGTVDDDDGEGQTNTASNVIYANNLPAGTYTSGVLDLSGRDAPDLGLGAGESQGLFPSPKTFDSISDVSLNDIPWTDGVLSGTFDLSLVATGSKTNIKRGGKGAFGTADLATEDALVAPGDSVTLDALAVSDLQGDLAGRSVTNLRLIAVYLGNETANDGATINDLPADGAASGDTAETMRNDIDPTTSALITGTGTGNGYSINGIDITFDTVPGVPELKVVSAGFNAGGELVVTFSGLNIGTTYELRYSPDILTPFTLVPGTTKMPDRRTRSRTLHQLFHAKASTNSGPPRSLLSKHSAHKLPMTLPRVPSSTKSLSPEPQPCLPSISLLFCFPPPPHRHIYATLLRSQHSETHFQHENQVPQTFFYPPRFRCRF